MHDRNIYKERKVAASIKNKVKKNMLSNDENKKVFKASFSALICYKIILLVCFLLRM